MKTNSITKRAFALLIALLLLVLPACQENSSDQSGPASGVEAVVDETGEATELPWLTMVIDSPMIPSTFVQQFLQSVPGYGTEFHVEYELINPLAMTVEGDDGKPAEDPEIRLRRMRTEMMAGKGPDIFLCDCASTALWEEDGQPWLAEPTFHYPEQAMRHKVFLPLDEYIEQAELMEWDKLNPTVMEAGRYDGQQMILPMKYQFDVACVDPAGADLDLAREYAQLPTTEYLWMVGDESRYTDLLSYFGQPGDYEQDMPSFTEDELLDLALSGLDTAQKNRTGYFDSLLNAQENVFLCGPLSRFYFPGSYNELPAYTMLPSYNRDGGVTASITCFVAVNANTKHPEEAFRVIDRLMSEDVQQTSYLTGSLSGVSVYDELGTATLPNGSSGNRWWMNEANYASFCALREQISAVKFYTLLDREAMFTVSKAYLAGDATEDSVKNAVHKAYTTMKMMLAES